ncbi:MAG: DoxX family protein [Actinobacteria bacterium]|nr:DoxX family protein [Actinomycetota bacterium]
MRRASPLGLAVLLAGSGVLHLVKPEPYERIVPRALGHEEFFVLASGIVELVAALLLVVPRTRRWGGALTAALLVAVFPANVSMALDGPDPDGGFFTGSALMLWLRLPLQPVLIWWAWSLVRTGAQPAGKA